jgi:Na+/melibiose symporter-like transporter
MTSRKPPLQHSMNTIILAGAMGTIWVTVCTPQAIFNVFLVNYLGASSETLGILIGLMQTASLLQLVSVFIFAKLPSRKPFWLITSMLHRLASFGVMIAAMISASPSNRGISIRIVVISMVISWALTNVSSSGWLSWMVDIIPEKIRGTFFLRRSSVAQFVTVVWFFLASLAIDLFPENRMALIYTIVIGLGALSGVIDILLYINIPEPVKAHIASNTAGSPGSTSGMIAFKDFLEPLGNGNFVRYSVSIGAAIFAMNLIGPFQAPWITAKDGIGAPLTWLGIMTVISQLAWVVVAPFWGVVMDRFGRKYVVLIGLLTTAGWILYLFVTPVNYVYLLPMIALIGGVFGPAFHEGAGQLMLSLAPEKNRVAYIAWYGTIASIVSAISPVLGGKLKDYLADSRFYLGTLELRGFHIVQAISIVLIFLAGILISRTKEGREKPLAEIISQFAGGAIIRSFVSLSALNKVPGSRRVEDTLRHIDNDSGALVLQEIIERLGDPASEVREEAARALGRIGDKEAVPALVSVLSDSQSTIRIEVARALGRIGDPAAVPPLADAMASSSQELRAACAKALGSIRGVEATKALLTAFRSERDHSVLVMGAEAMSGARDAGSEASYEAFAAVWELFPRLVETSNEILRKQYAIAIANLMGRPGEFYQYLTGSQDEKSARRKILEDNFRQGMKGIFQSNGKAISHEAHDLAALEGLLSMTQEARAQNAWTEALRMLFTASSMLTQMVFAKEIDSPDLVELAMKLDMRLGTWCWIVREATKLESRLDDATRELLVLIGYYYISTYA